MNDQLLFILCIVAAVVLIAWLVMQMFNKEGSRLRERLESRPDAAGSLLDESVAEAKPKPKLKDLFVQLGQACAQPFMPETREKQGPLRKKLAMAGIYSNSAVRTVAGAKLIFMVVGIGFGYLLGLMVNNLLIGFSAGGLAGYLAPTMWLKMKVGKQQKALDHGLPDALDLMVVCVEAGLSVDAAMQRVGQELHLAHPAVSKELEITHMETRVGVSRADSLRNMATRTGNAAVQALVSMLIQADRFGTSVAQALRVHADSLRNIRQTKAEEMAAKASVKMSFPLVLFIFPATFLVLAGPTVVQLMKSDLFK